MLGPAADRRYTGQPARSPRGDPRLDTSSPRHRRHGACFGRTIRHDDEPAGRGAPRQDRVEVLARDVGGPSRPPDQHLLQPARRRARHRGAAAGDLDGPEGVCRSRSRRSTPTRSRASVAPPASPSPRPCWPSRLRPRTLRSSSGPTPTSKRSRSPRSPRAFRSTAPGPAPTPRTEPVGMSALAGRRVVLGVSGGIAAYKAIDVCRRLVDAGAHVVPVLTSGRPALRR